jgi:protein TonB
MPRTLPAAVLAASLLATAAGAQTRPVPAISASTAAAPDNGRARIARLEAGWVSEADYPPAARRAGAEGEVIVRYLIGSDGEVEACEVVASSGNADLDAVTCTIVSDRFVFEPARDREGRRTAETRRQRFIWRLPAPPQPAR